jgi:hypothetical protein
MINGGYMKQIWTISIIIASFFTLTLVDRVFGDEIRYREDVTQNDQAGAAAPDAAVGALSSKPLVTNKSDEPASVSLSAPGISNNQEKMVRYNKSDDGVGESK